MSKDDKLNLLRKKGFKKEKAYSNEHAQIGLEMRIEELESKKQDREQRRIFSYIILGFVCIYMLCVLAVVCLDGLGLLSVDSNIQSVLLGTTTIEVIGLLAIVARYLFPKR